MQSLQLNLCRPPVAGEISFCGQASLYMAFVDLEKGID